MKMTLLEIVQSVLSDGDADEINSISDTPEGTQVATIVRDVYFQILAWDGVPELTSSFFTLSALGDTTRPTYLQLPDNIRELFWWKYDTQTSTDTEAMWSKITYYTPEKFFEKLSMRTTGDTNVTEFNSTDGVPLRIQTDKAPEFYTILEDKFIVCDSYDSAVDSTLQASKTVASGLEEPVFTISDSFTPVLDANLFPFLLAEVKAYAFATILKQQVNPKVEQIAREQKIRNQNQRHRFKHLNKHNTRTSGTDYGRRRGHVRTVFNENS